MSAMKNGYFAKLLGIWSRPADFFSDPSLGDPSKAVPFAAVTGACVALELGTWEALTGGSLGMVALVTGLLLAGLPLVVLAGAFLWSRFMGLCAYFLGESLPASRCFPVVAYSMAGLTAFILGPGLGKWFALSAFLFQFLGFERSLSYSRWMSLVLVGLPFSMAAVLTLFFGSIFKIH
jgi:hypothetical protein